MLQTLAAKPVHLIYPSLLSRHSLDWQKLIINYDLYNYYQEATRVLHIYKKTNKKCR